MIVQELLEASTPEMADDVAAEILEEPEWFTVEPIKTNKIHLDSKPQKLKSKCKTSQLQSFFWFTTQNTEKEEGLEEPSWVVSRPFVKKLRFVPSVLFTNMPVMCSDCENIICYAC